MAATSSGAILEFWEHMTDESHVTVCSTFSSKSRETFDKLSTGNASFEDKRAVTIFLLQTGALEIQLQKAVDTHEYQKIVLPIVKESPRKESKLSRSNERGAQDGKRGLSKPVETSEAKPLKNDSDIVQDTKDVSVSDDEDGNFNDFGGGDSDSDPGENSSSIKTKRKSVDENPAIETTKERKDVIYQDIVSTDEVRQHFTRSRKRLTVVLPKLNLSEVKKQRSEIKSRKVKPDDMIDIENRFNGDKDDDDDNEGDSDYDVDGGDDDADDDWKPDKEDEEMAKHEEEEKDMETEGAKDGNGLPEESQDGKEARVCQKCAAVSYSPWESDMHALECTQAEYRTVYKCHKCRRRCCTKWGITYHLVTKHKMSGPEALAKMPELDVSKMKNGGRGRRGKRKKNADARESPESEVDDVDLEEEVKDFDKEVEKKLLEGIVNNTLEQLRVQESDEVPGAADQNASRDSSAPPTASVDFERTCKICFMELPTRRSLYLHSKAAHFDKQEENFKCSTCDKEFTKRVTFKKHLRMHLEKGRGITHKCAKCDKVFCSQGALTNHRIIHEKGEKSYKCSFCDKMFTYNSGRQRHILLHHERTRPYPCKECDREFLQKYQLRDHMQIHSNLKAFKCDICEKAFNTRGSLGAHKKAVHVEPDAVLCDLCGATFKTQGSLMAHHREQHQGIRDFQCTHCGKRFTRSSRLKQHEMTHSVGLPHKCNICQMAFRYLYEFNSHISEHEGIEQLSCNICHKFFMRPSNLAKHRENAHKKEKRFFCYLCNFGCLRYNLLEKHIVQEHASESPNRGTSNVDESANTPITSRRIYTKHQEPRPYVHKMKYQCAECGEKFHFKNDFKIHEGSHKGIEPITCTICNKAFLKPNSLKNHMSVHRMRPVMKYTCSECGDGYTCYRRYRKHMGEKHDIKLKKNRTPSKKGKAKGSVEADGATDSQPEPEKRDNTAYENTAVEEVVLETGTSTSVIVVNGEDMDVDPTLAIIQMLYQEQNKEMQTVEAGTS